jgi:hypothetical protein
MSDFSLQSGPKRTLISSLSPIAIYEYTPLGLWPATQEGRERVDASYTSLPYARIAVGPLPDSESFITPSANSFANAAITASRAPPDHFVGAAEQRQR